METAYSDNAGKPCKMYEDRICPGHEKCDYRYCDLQLKELEEKIQESIRLCRNIIMEIEAKNEDIATLIQLQIKFDIILESCRQHLDFWKKH